jgi:hypothetical protein
MIAYCGLLRKSYAALMTGVIRGALVYADGTGLRESLKAFALSRSSNRINSPVS